MQEQSEKLEAFLRTITEESSYEAERIMERLSDDRLRSVERYESSLEAEVERYKAARQSELQAREAHRVNTRMTENKQKLLLYREDCAREVFGEVRMRLEEFAKSPEYLDHLKKLLRAASERVGFGDVAEVYLRREDMRFADELSDFAPGFELSFLEGQFHYGGLRFVCHPRRMSIDMSFDTALQDMIGHFAEMSGMRVE